MIDPIINTHSELIQVNQLADLAMDYIRYLGCSIAGVKSTLIAFDYLTDNRDEATKEIRNVLHALTAMFFGPIIINILIVKFLEIVGK